MLKKRFGKEIVAALTGIVFAYLWQVFALAITQNISLENLIPSVSIQMIIAPMVTWCAFGVLHVKWFKAYYAITAYGLTIALPLAPILLFGIMIFPERVETPTFWVVVLLVTAIPAVPFAKAMHRWLKQARQA